MNSGIWAAAEASIAICCGCLITLRPLFATLILGTSVRQHIKSFQRSGSGSEPVSMLRSKQSREAMFLGLENEHSWRHNVSVQGGKESRLGVENRVEMDEMELPINAIQVQTEVAITKSDRIEYKNWLF